MLSPTITSIHFGSSFHCQIYQSQWDLYNKSTTLHRDRERSSFLPQSHARRAARALSLKKIGLLALYYTHENNKLKDSVSCSQIMSRAWNFLLYTQDLLFSTHERFTQNENSDHRHRLEEKPEKTVSEKRALKFHTDDVSLPDQGGASDWSCHERLLLQPIRSTT